MTTVNLGETYKDALTGFTGVATGRHEYLYGCVRVTLEAGKDGDLKEFSFDEQRLVLAATGETPEPTATSGGPQKEPPSRSTGR